MNEQSTYWNDSLKHNYGLVTLLKLILIHFLSTLLFFSFRFIYDDGWSYTGGYRQGYRNGKGEEEWADGSREIAYRVAGKGKEGAAKHYDKNGNEEDRFYEDDNLVEQ